MNVEWDGFINDVGLSVVVCWFVFMNVKIFVLRFVYFVLGNVKIGVIIVIVKKCVVSFVCCVVRCVCGNVVIISV